MHNEYKSGSSRNIIDDQLPLGLIDQAYHIPGVIIANAVIHLRKMFRLDYLLFIMPRLMLISLDYLSGSYVCLFTLIFLNGRNFTPQLLASRRTGRYQAGEIFLR